jgi:hypothetical protein
METLRQRRQLQTVLIRLAPPHTDGDMKEGNRDTEDGEWWAVQREAEGARRRATSEGRNISLWVMYKCDVIKAVGVRYATVGRNATITRSASPSHRETETEKQRAKASVSLLFSPSLTHWQGHAYLQAGTRGAALATAGGRVERHRARQVVNPATTR